MSDFTRPWKIARTAVIHYAARAAVSAPPDRRDAALKQATDEAVLCVRAELDDRTGLEAEVRAALAEGRW